MTRAAAHQDDLPKKPSSIGNYASISGSLYGFFAYKSRELTLLHLFSYLVDIAQQVEELGAESVEPLMKAIELFVPKRAKSQHSQGMKKCLSSFNYHEASRLGSESTWVTSRAPKAEDDENLIGLGSYAGRRLPQ